MSTIKRSKTDAFSVKESVNIVKLAEAAFEQISLDQLTDVVVETPTDGDILVYSSDLMAWENVPQAGLNYGLEDLDNITITSASDGQVLTWDSSTSKWVNETPTTGATTLDGLTDVIITTPSNGQVLKYNGSAWVNGTDSGATPGGSDTYVQYNDGGVLGGKSSFTFNDTTDTLAVPKVSASDGLYTLSASSLGFGSARIYDSGDEMGFIADATDNLGLDTRAFRFNTASAAPEFYDGTTYRAMYHAGNLPASTPDAVDVTYDNVTSGLTSTDVQGAIDELTILADPFTIFNKTFLYKHGYGVYLPASAGFMKLECDGIVGWNSAEGGAQTGQFKTSGKWYFEVEVHSVNAGLLSPQIGVAGPGMHRNNPGTSTSAGGVGWTIIKDGRKLSAGSYVAYGSAINASDIIGVAVDLTGGSGAGKIWFAINNTWQASGDPVAGTNAAYTNLYALVSPAMYAMSAAATLRIASSAFSYTPPTGFSAWDS